MTMASEQAIGPYILGETLGNGSFGFVTSGTHRSSGERVAVKFLLNDAKESAHQLNTEVNALFKLSHPNVLKCKGFDRNAVYTTQTGADLNVCAIVLELATNGELFTMLAQSGAFEEVVARSFFKQLVAGIAHCHSNGIAHCDIKPENLLLDHAFTLKLADFGSAVSTLTMKYPAGDGTAGYTAPEIKSMTGYDAAKADVWSCGIVLFMLLTSHPPFKDAVKGNWHYDQLCEKQHAVFWRAHTKTAYVSDDARDLINKILEPNPTKRASLQTILNHRWLSNGPVLSAHALQLDLQKRKQQIDSVQTATPDTTLKPTVPATTTNTTTNF